MIAADLGPRGRVESRTKGQRVALEFASLGVALNDGRFVDVGIAIGKSEDFEVNTKLPTRVKIGMTRYFGAAIPTTPITAEGLWIYKSTGWTQIV